MSRIEDFGATQDVEITVLVDNRADLMVKSTDTVKHFTEEPLLAEHGFAALIDLKDAGERILRIVLASRRSASSPTRCQTSSCWAL